MRDRFAEFRVRFVFSRRGLKRWTPMVITDRVYQSLASRTDIYWSIQRYREDALSVSSVEQLGDMEYVAPLMFDLDCHESTAGLHRVAGLTLSLCRWLQERLHLLPGEVFIWFSGRGFHVAVPAEVVLRHPVTPVDELNRRFRKLAGLAVREIPLKRKVWIREGEQRVQVSASPLDYSIYAGRKLIRIPGSKHSSPLLKRLNRKIRLTSSHLATLVSKRESKEFKASLSALVDTAFLSPEEWI